MVNRSDSGEARNDYINVQPPRGKRLWPPHATLIPSAGASRRVWRSLGRLGLRVLLLAWLGGLMGLASGCGPTAAASKKKNSQVEVRVAFPIYAEQTDIEEFTGRLDAANKVEIRPRASGYLLQGIAPEQEGQMVQKGQLLFLIEPKPYQVDLAQAEANLRLAQAERVLQERNAERARRLLPSGTVRQEEFDTILAAVDKAVATIESQKQMVEKARINLGYTEVRSPLTGRVSRRNVDPGNLVKADDTLLTTVVSEDPYYAYFDVDERTYLNLVKVPPAPVGLPPSAGSLSTWIASTRSFFKDLKFPVWISLANEEQFTHRGVVDFKDNQINAGTGTIRMRGVFHDSGWFFARDIFKPGLYTRVRIPTSRPYTATLIPDEVIQSDQGKKFVYALKDIHEEEVETARGEHVQALFGTVEYRSVVLGQPYNKQLRSIKEGIRPNDQVLLTNLQQVRPGQKVRIAPPNKPGRE